MFTNNRPGGFAIQFDNGYTVSVVFAAGSYSDNGRNYNFDEVIPAASENCETAVIKPDGEFLRREGDNDDVRGWQTPQEVADTLSWVATLGGE